MLTRAEIAVLIPHAGTMVLIDEVRHWDARSIRCASTSHRRADNPLRHDGMLPAVCGIEYGCQAMAIHGALSSGGKAPRGILVAVRDVMLHADRLDTIGAELIVTANQETQGRDAAIYRFAIAGGDGDAISGRITIALR